MKYIKYIFLIIAYVYLGVCFLNIFLALLGSNTASIIGLPINIAYIFLFSALTLRKIRKTFANH